MQRAIEKFRLNIKSVKDLDVIYGLLTTNYPLLEEQAGDILRAEIVLAVSALDCFIHDLVKQGMIETYQGVRTPSKQFESYQLPFKFLKLIEREQLDFLHLINEDNTLSKDDLQNAINQNETIKLSLLKKTIEEVNSKDSYQSVKNINYALGLINIEKIWKKTSDLMGINAKDIIDELSLIINRRNKIAHEADYDTLGFKAPIEQQNINDVIRFIEKLCESIYQIAQNEII